MKKTLTIILSLLICTPCYGAIAYDSVSARCESGWITNTWSHAIGSGSNRILVVGVPQEGGGNVTGVTYNGTALSKVIEVANGSNTVELWYILEADLPSAGSYNIVVTASSNIVGYCIGVSLSGVKQEAPEVSTSNTASSSGTITSSITTLTDTAWIVDAISCGETGALTATETGQSLRAEGQCGATMEGGMSTRPTTSNGAYNMSWSGGGSNRKAHVLLDVAPAGVAGRTRRFF